MKLLFVHQNFPGQYKHLAPALAAQGHEVRALGMTERVDLPGVQYQRYGTRRASTKGLHPWVVDFEAKVIRGEACAQAARRLRESGFVPDLIFKSDKSAFTGLQMDRLLHDLREGKLPAEAEDDEDLS